MATPYPIPVTAAQVGTYFVGQYYQVLQQQPELVHQFYSDASTMIRIDGQARETATAMLQIHALVMSLNYIAVEIKTAHSLESWNGGVIVMVSGSVHMKTFSGRRKFVQTFFLAPQEKGYFVLNDIFHFIDDEPIHQHHAVMLAQSNLDSKLSASSAVPEPVSNYTLGAEIQSREFASPADVEENGPGDKYSFQEQHRPEKTLETISPQESNGSLQNATNSVQDHLPPSLEVPVGEPQKHTYASILRVAKGQTMPLTSPQPAINRNEMSAEEWNDSSHPPAQQSVVSSNAHERSGAEGAEEFSGLDNEGEIKSVYVRNLLPKMEAYEIAEEFRKFGKLRPEGVVIRGRKDLGVCYAFIEFEDMDGVHNAVKAGSVHVAGRPLYIEERRPNRKITSRGGMRGRGRGSYQSEAPRGRFNSRGFARGNGHDGGEREYSRPRGNGFYRPGPRQDRGFSGQQGSRSVQNQ